MAEIKKNVSSASANVSGGYKRSKDAEGSKTTRGSKSTCSGKSVKGAGGTGGNKNSSLEKPLESRNRTDAEKSPRAAKKNTGSVKKASSKKTSSAARRSSSCSNSSKDGRSSKCGSSSRYGGSSRYGRAGRGGKNRPSVFFKTDSVLLFCACVVLASAVLLIFTRALDLQKTERIKDAFARATEQKISGVQEAVEGAGPGGGADSVRSSEGGRSIGRSEESGSTRDATHTRNTDAATTNTAAPSRNTNAPSSNTRASRVPAETRPATHTRSAATDTRDVTDTRNTDARSATHPRSSDAAVSESSVRPSPANGVFDAHDFPDSHTGAVLVFLFDDGGQNLNHLEKFVSLPFPVTVAVLPALPNSKASAERVRKSGNELMLHQPMQAVNLSVNPGPGAIKPGMDEGEIRATLFKNLREIGPVSGVNNHEGSLITEDAQMMSHIMKMLSDEGLYFLDSRTTAYTKVPYVSRSLGYPYYQRNIFLDNTKNRADIIHEIKKGLEHANRNGFAVMIGHVWSADILPDILLEIYPVLYAKGYRFSTVSKIPAHTF